MHYLLYGLGAILIAWGLSDFALNFSENGVLPLIVTYGGVSNITIGVIMMGLGRCIQILQNLQGSAASSQPVTAGLKSIQIPDAAEPVMAQPEPEKQEMIPEPTVEPASEISTPEEVELDEPVEPEIEDEPEVADEIVEPQDDIAPSSLGSIIQEGDIRGYAFRIYESGEIELETKSGWHVFKTIEEVQAHIAAETSA